MALFLKVLTLTPCFSKCKFLCSETVLEFYARNVHCTKSDSLCKSIHFAPFISTSHTHIILKSILLCKKSICITEKYNILIEYQRKSHENCFYVYNCVTPLTKLGELGSELVCNCISKSKTGVQVNDNIKTCYSHEGSTKKLQIFFNQ